MHFTEDLKDEQEIATSVKSSSLHIKNIISSYQGQSPVLQKLKAKLIDLSHEADVRHGSFPMEKLMGLVRKTQAKNADPDVLQFFASIQEHINTVTDGIQNIVERNLGLVGHLINKFKSHDDSYLREDRMQDGSAGLLKAAYRFDPDRNIKFSTYACWWIKQEARLGYMSMSRTIRWPSNVYQAMGKSEEVFLSALGKNSEVVFAATCAEPVSIDEPLASGSTDEPLVNFLQSSTAVPLEDIVDHREIATIIRNSIDSLLTTKEAQVIRARFGLGQKSDHILADIGKMLGVSPERVRHIQNDALLKLKDCVNIDKLQGHYA